MKRVHLALLCGVLMVAAVAHGDIFDAEKANDVMARVESVIPPNEYPASGPPCFQQYSCHRSAFFGSNMAMLQCLLGMDPLTPGTVEYKRWVLRRFDQLTGHFLKGQQHVVDAVRIALMRKLSFPEEPLVLHFAGDNGVGKTSLAQLISRAFAFRCGDPTCQTGDSALVISGVSFDGMSVREFRDRVTSRIIRHVRKFPKNAVIVINELNALHKSHVQLLLPVLGRAHAFPEDPRADLRHLTVIITTDFGRQGSTRGMSVDEIRRYIISEFKDLYSHLAATAVETFPFLPLSLAGAEGIVRQTLNEYVCRFSSRLASLTPSEEVVDWFMQEVKPDLDMENGRAVVRVVSHTVGPLLETILGQSSGHDRLHAALRITDAGDIEIFVEKA